MNENFLPRAFFISLTVHTIIICGNFLLHPPENRRGAPGQVEISYRADAGKREIDVHEHPIKPSQRLDLKSTTLMPTDGTIPLRLGQDNQALAGTFMVQERKPEKIRSEMSHHVSIVPIKSEKINNPAYAAYNEMVRSRIEEKVYENYRKRESGAGVVYLTFVVGSDGSLRAAQIIEDKTHASANLKNTSLQSLQESKFPPFYKGMTLPEYTFNIEIQYTVGQ